MATPRDLSRNRPWLLGMSMPGAGGTISGRCAFASADFACDSLRIVTTEEVAKTGKTGEAVQAVTEEAIGENDGDGQKLGKAGSDPLTLSKPRKQEEKRPQDGAASQTDPGLRLAFRSTGTQMYPKGQGGQI